MLVKLTAIDVQGTFRDRGLVQLCIAVEHGEWALPNRLLLLQEKVNTYLEYALDGQMVKDDATKAGLAVEIVIASTDPLPQDVADFIGRMRPVVEAEDVRLSVEERAAKAAA